MATTNGSGSSGTYRFHSERPRRKAPTVVLAFTDSTVRRDFHDHLTEAGLTVVDAASVDEVLDLSGRFFAEIAIIDLDGLGYDALPVAQQLRSNGHTLAIGLTSRATPLIVAFTRKAGFAEVLRAPCDPATLLTEILVQLAAAAQDEVLTAVV